MDIYFISGMPAGDTGTGRFVQTLVRQGKECKNARICVLYNTSENPKWLHDILHCQDIIDADHVVLLHPQTLGFRWCMEFFQYRKKRTWIYVLDAGFFCVRSYNHIPGEFSACLRCLGGNFDWAHKLHCPVFPAPQDDAVSFLMLLKKKVQASQIVFFAQNESYKKLLHTHFGEEAVVHTVGMWAADFDELFHKKSKKNDALVNAPCFDVVFHGNSHPAKGTLWTNVLAGFMRQHSFLFPFLDIDQLDSMPQENIFFSNMKWFKGLADQVSRARITLCPSLWSAPIEGALIKSILQGNSVAVVDEPTSFSSEIPSDVILKLHQNPEKSAEMMSDNLQQRCIDHDRAKNNWISTFIGNNENVLKNIIDKM